MLIIPVSVFKRILGVISADGKIKSMNISNVIFLNCSFYFINISFFGKVAEGCPFVKKKIKKIFIEIQTSILLFL